MFIILNICSRFGDFIYFDGWGFKDGDYSSLIGCIIKDANKLPQMFTRCQFRHSSKEENMILITLEKNRLSITVIKPSRA